VPSRRSELSIELVGPPLERRRTGEDGFVLLLVSLLIIVFGTLGILSLRHTRSDLRSATSYQDATQAGLLSESGIAITSADMALNWDFFPIAGGTGCRGYRWQFEEFARLHPTLVPPTPSEQNPLESQYTDLYSNQTCTSGVLDSNGTQMPVDNPNSNVDAGLASASPLMGGATSNVRNRIIGIRDVPAPRDFSQPSDSNQTVGWYQIEMMVTASAGERLDPSVTNPQDLQTVRGQARARALVKLGPVTKIAVQL